MKKQLTIIIACLFITASNVCAEAPCTSTKMKPHVAEKPDYERIIKQLNEDSDKTLAVKNIDPAWVRSLDKRGEPIVYTRANSANFDYIGMPIGGLCAGQMYLGGDGKLWCWDIFNTKSQRDVRGVPTYMNPYKRSEPDAKAHHQVKQGFAIRLKNGDSMVTKTLDRDGLKDIEFRGNYPIGEVTYSEKGFPVKVELEAFSPFIPLDLENSIYPAIILNYTVTNTSKEKIIGDLVGWMENAVCIKSRETVLCNDEIRVINKPGLTLLHFLAEAVPVDATELKRPDIIFEDFEKDLSRWTIEGDAFEGNPKPNFHHQELKGYKGTGLADSFCNSGKADARSGPASDAHKGKLVSKEFSIGRKAIKFLIGGGNHKGQTCLNLVVDGKVVRSATGGNSEELIPGIFSIAGLEGKKAHLEIVDSHSGGWGHVLVDQIVFSDDTSKDAIPLEELPDYGSMALGIIGQSKRIKAVPDFEPPDGSLDNFDVLMREKAAKGPLVGTLGREFTLAPGEKAEVRFILSWYFPNVKRPIRTAQGHYYAKRFKSASDVASHIAKNYDSLAGQTRLWRDTWLDSTLPYWLLDRTFLNTANMATNTCNLMSDGRFFGWEGVYHSMGTCTHVWGYVQAPGRLFPEIERRLREMVDYKPGIGFVPETGLIAYRSGRSFHPAVDGQAGIILRTYLVHQMQKDDAFLKRVYPSMKKAMNYLTNTHDADRDGILTGGQHNTLDARWYGKITWLSLHYTSALCAAAAMADEMGDTKYASQCRSLADRGRKYIEEKLFNGEYFFHERDPEHPDSPGVYGGLEYSQLLGQSWAYQVGLGRILDPEKATTHLRSLWKYNFATDVGPFREKYTNGRWYAMPGEGGIIACTWPRGGDDALKLGHQHYAGYLNECQPGYEWAVTSLMMWHDMPFHALAHTRTMHERYDGVKRNPWNEVEWGSHYSRSMASYGVFTAACGFEYHGPRGYIAFSPRLTPEDFKAAFTSAGGWGTFTQKRTDTTQTERLEVRWGKLALRQLAFDLVADATAKDIAVTVGEKKIDATFTMRENRVEITLPRPVTIKAGKELTVEITVKEN